MLSRIIARTASLQQPRQWVAFRLSSTSTTDDFCIFANEKNPQRDHVNFPRRKRPIHPDPVRHKFIPEEWFQFFHPKTGVTGPYVFAATFTTYLVSKEIWVLEHEFYTGLSLFMVLALIYNKVSPAANSYAIKKLDEHEVELDSVRQKEIQRCQQAVADEEKAQWMGSSYEQLIEAKRENVALQLEAEYRGRLKDAYNQVKRRLDYQLQTANVIRAHEQRHMVDWVISNVMKSITPKQEEDALKKCVADLKALAK